MLRPLIVCALLVSAAAVHAAEPLRTAWAPLVPTAERAEEIKAMTSAQKYDDQIKAITAAQKATRGKTFALRLKCTGVIEPPEKDGLMLVHGQYVDEEMQRLFGKDATVGIWTRDYKAGLKLKLGREFEIQGKIICQVNHLANDVGQEPNFWSTKTINTGVVFFDYPLTHWVREARIYMVNPAIVLLPAAKTPDGPRPPYGLTSESAR